MKTKYRGKNFKNKNNNKKSFNDIGNEHIGKNILKIRSLLLPVCALLIATLTFMLNSPEIQITNSVINVSDLKNIYKFKIDKPYMIAYKDEDNIINLLLGITVNNTGNMVAKNLFIKSNITVLSTKTNGEIIIRNNLGYASRKMDIVPNDPFSFVMSALLSSRNHDKLELIIREINNGYGFADVEVNVSFSHPWFTFIRYNVLTSLKYFNNRVEIMELKRRYSLFSPRQIYSNHQPSEKVGAFPDIFK